MRGGAALLGLWLLLLAGGQLMAHRQRSEFGRLAAEKRERGDILLDVFGEFRTVMARYLWFKMDLFHEVLDDEGIDNAKQTEVLPMLRMISLLDPSITDAFDNIAWDLYHGHDQAEQALSILDEGLERNHGSFQLYFRRALILYQEKRFKEATESAEEATHLAQGEFDILNAQRLLYWSASQAGEPKLANQALTVLQEMRPDDELWRAQKAKMDAAPP